MPVAGFQKAKKEEMDLEVTPWRISKISSQRLPLGRTGCLFPLPARRTFPNMLSEEIEMKIHVGQAPGKNISVMIAVIAAIMFLFPVSSSVICVAPGGHIAIENANAICCAPSISFAPESRLQLDLGFGAASNCWNCTDIYINTDARRAVALPSHDAFADFPAGECLDDELCADLFLLQMGMGAFNNVGISPLPAVAAVPLRC